MDERREEITYRHSLKMLQDSHGYESKLVHDEPKTAHFDETLRFMTQAHAHIVSLSKSGHHLGKSWGQKKNVSLGRVRPIFNRPTPTGL